MKKKKKWKHFKKSIITGSLIGLVVGFILLFISFSIIDFVVNDIYIYYTIGLPFVFSEGASRALGLCEGWNCLGFNIFGGIIIYVILGGVIGFLIKIIKKK